jgi:hypothetical protein
MVGGFLLLLSEIAPLFDTFSPQAF